MAETSEDIVINIDVEQTLTRLAEVNKRLAELKQATAEANKAIKEGKGDLNALSDAVARNAKETTLLQGEQKSLTGIVQQSVKFNASLGDSYNEISARVSQLQKEYKSLTAEQRNSAQGKELLKAIADQKQELKDLDATMGDFQRNVGNYPKTVTAIIPGFDQLNATLGKMGVSADDFAGKGTKAFSSIGTSFKALGKAFLANPIGLILTALVVVIGKVVSAFKKSDDAGTNLQRAFSALQPIINVVNKAFEVLANVIANTVLAISKGIKAVAEFTAGLFGMGDALAEANKNAEELVMAEDNLQDAERQYTVNSAKRNAEISELRAKALDKEKYTAKEREELLQKAIDLEKHNLEEDKKIKAEKLRILQAQAEQEADTSDDTKNKIAQAQAELFNAEKTYNDRSRELGAQLLEARRTDNAEQKKLIDERIAKEQEALEEEKRIQAEWLALYNELTKDLEDAILANMQEGEEKQIAERTLQYEREIEALKVKYGKEFETNAEYQDLLLQKQTEYGNDIAEIQATNAENAERLKAERLQAIQDELQAVEDERNRGNFEYEQQRRAERHEAEMEALRTRLADKANLVAGEEDALNALLLEKEQAYNDESVRLSEEAQKKQVQIASARAQTSLNAFGAVLDGIGQLAGAFAKDDKERAQQEKVMAIGKAAVASGIAIAQGVAQAQSVPFPANIAAIATTVGTVLANIATAVSTIKGAKFAEGGIVEGAFTTGDRIHARVNAGEMILTKEQQARLFDIANARTQAGGIDYEALALAVANTPAPVMVYSEFNEFTGKVAQFNELAKL